MPADQARTVARLLDRYGQTYAEEAGIRLADRPAPLYQLLVLCLLLSARISGDVAVAAARELFAAGLRTASAMRDTGWQDRVDALGRGHYRRYDERTATMLGDGAQLCLDRWRGDLRRLHAEAGDDPAALRKLLTGFPGIGATGADIFLREVQGVWPQAGPYVDGRVVKGASALGLPTTSRELANLVDEADLPRLCAALVRMVRDRDGAEHVRRDAAAAE